MSFYFPSNVGLFGVCEWKFLRTRERSQQYVYCGRVFLVINFYCNRSQLELVISWEKCGLCSDMAEIE